MTTPKANPDPADLLNAVATPLTTWAKSKGGAVSIAEDPFHVLEILGESPTGFRVIVHWAGDDDQANQELAGVVTNKLEVIVSHNRGLAARTGSNLITPRAGQLPLYKLVSQARAVVRKIQFDEDTTSQKALYKGCAPITTPEGIPLDALKMTFTLESALPEEE